MEQWFEFHAYDAWGNPLNITRAELMLSGARSHAGRIAKKNNGPVDIALDEHCNSGFWHERYITTAYPSKFHASGYQFERLDG